MIQINGVHELNDFIINNINKVIVLYFGAEWCGPCKLLKERMKQEETSIMMPDLSMCYLDLDHEHNKKIFKCYKVEYFPTLIFIKLENDKVIELSRIEGFDFNQIQAKYEMYK